MTTRQKLLKIFYPLFVWYKKAKAAKTFLQNEKNRPPILSFYSLSAELNDGSILPFSKLKGKKVLIVNTASDCGYTAQYAELQQLHERFRASLVIIAFPSNDFKRQEKGSDEAIASFCKSNYGISFPIAGKTVVAKKPKQHQVYQWLTRKEMNGWNDRSPSWNFSKYLIDEDGTLQNYFEPFASPLSEEVLKALQR